jgi:putative aminopeptidase FrvX
MASTRTRGLEAELRELVALPAPTGAEDYVADWIEAQLAGLPGSPRRDALGNLLIGRETGARILVTAHMDQVGYMVSRVESDRACCLPLGSPRADPSRPLPVSILGETHMPLDGTIESSENRGVTLHSDRIEEIQVGDRAVFVRPLESLGGDLVRGPALDDRVGCLLVLEAARALGDADGDVTFAWTVREETDQAGVIRVARALDPDALIAVDITPSTTAQGGAESVISTGLGPAITLLDGGMVSHAPLVDMFDSAAKSLGITWQREVVPSGSSEAGRVQRSLGIPALPVLVPIENAHSDHEVGNLNDMLSAADLLIAGVRETLARLDGVSRRELVGSD